MRIAPRTVLTVAVLGLLILASRVGGSVGLLTSDGDSPIELRVALAVGPQRSTLWAQMILESDGGTVALVVPAAPGSSLDWSAPAWFEALEITTAPRVLPPLEPGVECAGISFEIEMTGDDSHFVPESAEALEVLSDADAVVSWALDQGLDVPGDLPGRLQALGPMRFVAIAFRPPAGRVLTPVLRVVSTAPSAQLPLVLTKAAEQDVLVTSWLIGAGAAQIDGASAAAVDPALLVFDREGSSNYPGLRLDALTAAGIGSTLTESASHASLEEGTPTGGAAVPSLVDTYFGRSAQQGTGDSNAAPCIAAAEAALSDTSAVANSCPRADLGVVEGIDDCTEVVGAGELDPALLRCGPGADDLAVALAGLAPASTWLTRISQRVAAGSAGLLDQVSFGGSSILHPVLQANRANCAPDRVPVYQVDSGGCGDPELGPIVFWVEVEVIIDEEQPDAYYVEEEDCGGDPGEPQEDDGYDAEFGVEDGEASESGGGEDCGGDTQPDAESTVTESDAESGSDGGCGGDTESTSESSSGEDCGGGTESTSDSSSSSSSSSSSGESSESSESSSDSGCGKDESGDDSSCTVARKRRRRPRMSLLLFGLTALLAPLRRLTKRRRRARTRPRG